MKPLASRPALLLSAGGTILRRLGVSGTSFSAINIAVQLLLCGEECFAQEFDKQSDIKDILTAISTRNVFGPEKIILVRDFEKRGKNERAAILDTPTESTVIVTSLMERKNSIAFFKDELPKLTDAIRTELQLDPIAKKLVDELAMLHQVTYDRPVLAYLLQNYSDPVSLRNMFCRACGAVCPNGNITTQLVQALERESSYEDDGLYGLAEDVVLCRSEGALPHVDTTVVIPVLTIMLRILFWIWQIKIMDMFQITDVFSDGPHRVLLHPNPKTNLAEKMKSSGGYMGSMKREARKASWKALTRNIENVVSALDSVTAGVSCNSDVLLRATRIGGICHESTD